MSNITEHVKYSYQQELYRDLVKYSFSHNDVHNVDLVTCNDIHCYKSSRNQDVILIPTVHRLIVQIVQRYKLMCPCLPECRVCLDDDSSSSSNITVQTMGSEPFSRRLTQIGNLKPEDSYYKHFQFLANHFRFSHKW